MGRFRGRRGSSSLLRKYVGQVEPILAQISPNTLRLPPERNKQGWKYTSGSAQIEIYVELYEGRGYFQVLSPLMHLPGNAPLLPLYRSLLERNLELTNAALGVDQDVVYIFSERPLEGLDNSEAEFIIKQVATYADDLDDILVEEFGGRLYGQPPI